MALPAVAEYTTRPEKWWDKLVKMTKMVKKLAQDDPRRVIYACKVGLALVLISILQHFRPSFYGFGSNIIWAAITISFIFEFSVGPTLAKGISEILATGLAGGLGVATRSIAILSGEKGKAVFSSFFVFVIGGIVTYVRLSPWLKARYDYGLTIFILNFCLICLLDYTKSEMLEIAVERFLTIIVGSCVAIVVSICICPVWVGHDLHNQIASDMEKLADFFEGFGDEYFNNSEISEAMGDKPLLHRYKSVLSSKSSDETMVFLARWEPCHGRFRFRHPWKQYTKIGNLTRLCAYKIEAISVYLASSKHIPSELGSKIKESCTSISLECGKALKESSLKMREMRKSSMQNRHVTNAKNGVESLKSALRANPWEGAYDQVEIISATAVASLLIKTVFCIEKICQAVDQLESLAKVQSISDGDGSLHVHTINEGPPKI
ncbi:aluminum-activated malate transporter 8-like [Abrus precatorius]|uniref:Aluminum-activated malate transporter 8-like n=1 Tax=Abrus precatorius TaxID=3816 RepID=A0A8B8KHV7_ABRPR|nr:aluminum-activated malate transporter 8-like [Abrus precatorius]